MSNQAKITCTNVWKLFGPDEKRIIKEIDKESLSTGKSININLIKKVLNNNE